MKSNQLAAPVFMAILTIIAFILMIKVLTGQIGYCETWRIVSSIIGFLGLLGFNFFFVYHLGKKSASKT